MSTPAPPEHLTPAFLEKLLRTQAANRAVRVLDATPFALDNSASILVTLTAGRSARPIGHFGLNLTLDLNGRRETHRVVLKLKPHGREISAMLAELARACGGELAAVYPRFADHTGFGQTHRREGEVYEQHPDPIQPRLWGALADDATETYAVLMKYLDPGEVTLLNSVNDPDAWTDAHLRAALEGLAAWHARHLTDAPPPWPDQPSAAYMTRLQPLWGALLANAAARFPDLCTPERTALLRRAIGEIPDRWAWLETRPRTLIHNDFNPRNLCFRRGEPLRVCAYDWELATHHVPVYDAVELLAFVLTPGRNARRGEFLEHYRQALHARTGRHSDREAFRRETRAAALDFGLHRLGMYLMAHSVGPYPFLPRVVESYFDGLNELSIEN